MIKNYFKQAFKSVIGQGHQSVISALGLSVALSCSILILIYVQYEISYDKFHKDAKHICRIVTKNSAEFSYMGQDVFAVTPAALKDALVRNIPEVENSTKCRLYSHTLEYKSSLFTEKGFLYADPDFLKIFTFPVISGNPDEVLKEPFTLFITIEMAAKYFGNEDPVGKILKADNKYLFTVMGILENIPLNSHFDFDFLTGFETLYQIRGGKGKIETWSNFSYSTYVKLLDNVAPEDIKDKLNELSENSLPKEPLFTDMQWIAEPMVNIHLGGNANFEPGKNSDIRYLYLIISIGIFILLIACFNYMNMATARAYSRGREIGILKVAGSSRIDLILQFLAESVILSLGGLILAIGIILIILPDFSVFTERPLIFRMIFEFDTLIRVLVLTFMTGIFAGLYPAIHLATKSPLHLIREDFKNPDGNKSPVKLRNLFVILQYTISIVALICTFTVLQQLNFVKKTDIGFRKDNILTISLSDPAIRKSPEVLINELRKEPEIVDISTSAYLPNAITSAGFGTWEGLPSEATVTVFRNGLGTDFIDFYDLEIVSGRGFSKDYSSDSTESYIINQTAAKKIGPDDPIGKKFGFKGSDPGIIIGVVKDFHFQSLRLAMEPLALSLLGSEEFSKTSYISVRVSPGKISDARSSVEKTLKELSPNYLNPVSILSDEIEAMYSSDKKLSIIFIFATILAVILTCLGQYSISAYTAKSRTKEMVIRKVMGSLPSGIMGKLVLEMSGWILISILFAWPAAYLLMNKWLQNFAFHADIGAGIFLLSLVITLLISLIAISYHVVKLSRVNPAEMIRHE